ncbi:hypothetical protein T492DRAFT_967832 [Pavlovales sp. CCMP2436]|nr:hypothetical protein T492DRAFT_967832 [Pavlovales sp. CCMP2436]|mmetsp:Transcript_15964/g.40768  ORF Transcript_15964/g.40768 Transcript_15964/m.40768 type:complete len:293 (+) Transcript_15964:111-989(+)|eukprot:CAMPEP_0179897528 /NCGR_PEP_ID=MMETSP0982-20121206/37062_1 /TAXON_ID=483367 /ORGANISM="non described non described, Strain CCMP 2436" /LENGTH=292 /DNA_ID=CAMNT_0021794581 /DNA_START=22 /DNA_END=903 /DNA_ORIENTATION=+
MSVLNQVEQRNGNAKGENASAPIGAHSHRSGQPASAPRDWQGRVTKIDPAEMVLRALDLDSAASSPPISPRTRTASPRRGLQRPGSIDQPITLALEDIIGRTPVPDATDRGQTRSRADALEAAIFDTITDDHGGWPAGSRLSMVVRVVNRWGLKADAELELEAGRMRYSKRVYTPPMLFDIVYDEADERCLLLHLNGRSRPKRVICTSNSGRDLLASWLAAWKIGAHPDAFHSHASSTFGLPGSGPGTFNAALRSGGSKSFGRSNSSGPVLTRSTVKAPSGRSGMFVLGARQ